MKTTQEILREVNQLSARERAAAIAHYVYMKTAERVGWGKRVPTEWGQLQPDARDFNIASIDTWTLEPELYEAWHDALKQLRKGA
ncbi:MAG: hypothetical protein HY882_04500 [Deltaproteobacteria bacterium]|nr:hypothetical protein [Deltaproteobacteria bacterium]